MKYETLQGLRDEAYRRRTGVKRKIFSKMIDILRKADTTKKNEAEEQTRN